MIKFLMTAAVFGILWVSCSKHKEEEFYAQEVEKNLSNVKQLDSVIFDDDKSLVDIQTVADANFFGLKNYKYYLDISGANRSYCHPDVLYFPESYRGFKYWMVFTPYFGAVGTNQSSKRYENPTVVVSNNGINWAAPSGLVNPLIGSPLPSESVKENSQDPVQGFWSDVDWVYVNNKFYLYYRGSFISAKAFKSKGIKTESSLNKLKTNAQRTIVQQTSNDGINWLTFEIAFTSNKPYTPQNSHLLSPSFINDGKEFSSYEINLNLDGKSFKGKDPSYIVRRTSEDGLNFSKFKESKIINFIEKPWLEINPNYSPWHIQASYVDGYYFLCIAIGDVKKYTSEALFFAYSKDGLNFKVYPKPIVEDKAYRSAIFPMFSDKIDIKMGAIIANKLGEFRYKEFLIKKQKIEDSLK